MELILMILAIILVAFVFFLAHKYSHKKLLITFLCVFSLIFLWFQYRHFYKVNDMTFTVWKTKNGCYIMPYRYWGFTLPKSNYVKVSNIGYVCIYTVVDSLYIFNDNTYDGDANNVECNFKNYRYKHFTPPIRNHKNEGSNEEEFEKYAEYRKLWGDRWNEYNSNLPFISIAARTMRIDVKY